MLERRFVPRVINPVKVERVVIFAADSRIRDSSKTLEEKMAWLRTEVLHDPQSALAASSERPSVFLFDDTALALLDVEQVRAKNKNAILVLLSYQPFIQCAPPQAAQANYPYTARADLVFAVDRDRLLPENIVLAAVRVAEDRLNIERHTSLKRFIFHIVDDEPRWFSQFLPVLYAIIGQRADVMVTRTYEESLRFLFGDGEEEETPPDGPGRGERGHGDDVICLITDIFFPRGSELQCDAGRELIGLVNSRFPRIPVIIASKAKEALELNKLGFILPKGDPGSLEKLKEYILNFTGMGDFLVCDDEGREIRRARNIREICAILLEAEEDSAEGRLRALLEAYGEKDKFSTWLYMHSYRELGDRLRPKKSRGHQLIALLKKHLRFELARMERTPLLLGGTKAFDLAGLLAALRALPPETLQPYSDNDIVSSWLDYKGFSELAEQLRPIHGRGRELKDILTDIVAKWLDIYKIQGEG
jgi:hypothetical protein